MESLQLLGIEYGLRASTKKDMVDEEWLELATDDVNHLYPGDFFKDAPIIPVSSADGSGLEALAAALEKIAANLPERVRFRFFPSAHRPGLYDERVWNGHHRYIDIRHRYGG